jgi:predicted SpoU family rRNA methylase
MTPVWKKVYQKDINTKLEYSKKEFDMYENTGYIIHLQQAGEKLFSAVENFLMVKYSRRVRSYEALLDEVKYVKNDSEILTQAVQLHYFFYNAELHMSYTNAEVIYKIVYDKMKARMKKHEK